MCSALGQLIAAIAAADLLVGVGHWLEDSYCGVTRTAEAGPRREDVFGGVCAANAWHHAEPLRMADSAWRRNALPLLVAGGGAALLALLGWLGWQSWVTLALIGVANEVHYWQHAPAPRWVRKLQAMGVLATPQQHALHHRGVHDTHYCLITNWLNPVLDGLRFWRGLEWLVAVALGYRVSRTVLVRTKTGAGDGVLTGAGAGPARVAREGGEF